MSKEEGTMETMHKKKYIPCTAQALTLENEDVLTAISGVDSGTNQANFSIDFNELFN